MERTLVTGGTGWLGRHIVSALLNCGTQVVSFASREHGHEEQRRVHDNPNLISFLGNVRDLDAVLSAVDSCTTVIHAAAQKCVPWAEEYPEECIKTNVQGTINVQKAAEKAGVKRAIYISSDKACKPINTYGASKYLGEKVWKGPIIRLGNLWGSTSSVIYRLLDQRGTGKMKITSRRMKRFHISAKKAVDFICDGVNHTPGIHIPAMRWYALEDLARAVDPAAEIVETGIRQGEKLEEDLYEDGTPYSASMRLSVEELRGEIARLCGSSAMAVTLR